MSFYAEIQALIGPNTPQNSENTQCWVDWSAYAWIIGPHPTIGGKTYLAQQQIFTGTEVKAIDTSTWVQPPFHEYPITADTTRGDVWVTAFQPSNLLIAAKQSDLSYDAQYAAATAVVQGEIIAKKAGNTEWIVMAGIDNLGLDFAAQKVSDGSLWTAGLVSYGPNQVHGTVCPGLPNSSLAYACSSGQDGGGGVGVDVRFYKLDLGSQVATYIGAINPTNVDPGWAGMTIDGMCVDQTDGKIVAWFNGSAGGAHDHYLAKFDPVTLAVSWATGMDGVYGPGNMMALSVISASRYYFYRVISGGVEAFTFDTTTGAATTSTNGLGQLVAFGNQASNDALGCICGIFGLGATGTPDPPIRLNTTPLYFQGWAMLYVASPITPSVPSGEPWMAVMGPARPRGATGA